MRTPLPGATGGPAIGDVQGSPPPRPDLCEWADAVDGILFGTIKEFELTMTPWVPLPSQGMTPEYDAPCDKPEQYTTMKFVISVEASIKGEFAGEQVIYSPSQRRGALNPSPSPNEDGSIAWSTSSGEIVESPIHVGQKIGMAFYYVSTHDIYTTMFEPYFGHDEEGKIIFQPGDASEAYKFYRAPALSSDVSLLADLAESIAGNCDGSSPLAVFRREMNRSGGAPNIDINEGSPMFSFAASCYEFD